MGLLHKRSAWLNRKLAVAGGLLVLYRRGTDEVQLTARSGNQPSTVEEAGRSANATRQVLLQTGERDYLIDLDELQRAGFDAPAVGDQIVETFPEAGVAITYEIRPTQGNPPWTWSDLTKTRFRLTTKKVSEEAA